MSVLVTRPLQLSRWSVALAVLFVGLGVAVIATTHNLSTGEYRVYENTTFKFMVTAAPDSWVDVSCQRVWANVWPGGSKCVAGFNLPMAGYQVQFALLRWSWKR